MSVSPTVYHLVATIHTDYGELWQIPVCYDPGIPPQTSGSPDRWDPGDPPETWVEDEDFSVVTCNRWPEIKINWRDLHPALREELEALLDEWDGTEQLIKEQENDRLENLAEARALHKIMEEK